MTYPTVLVDVDQVRIEHLIVVDDGVVVKVCGILAPDDHPGWSCRTWHFNYSLVKAAAGIDDLGTLDVPDGSTVECVRTADWLASRHPSAVTR